VPVNITPVIFNREILARYLSVFRVEDIVGYKEKYDEIQKWKKSAESDRLHKTKETSVQGLFLGAIFEKVLGYTTMMGGEEWNQVAELKSALDSSHADAALGFFSTGSKIVRAVVELKDANTNLDKKQNRNNHLTPVEQAFQYAHKNGSGCGWVIVSNFVEIRLYKSASSLEYEQFFITKLDCEDEFKRFYFLLCKDNLIIKSGKSLMDKLYDDNELARAEISNQFYNDYKTLRSDLFEALKANNDGMDAMTLFSKAQKILDRFIFICFCENRMLLPQGIFKNVIQAAKSSFVITYDNKPLNRLWEQLRGLFHSIDIGNPPMQIIGYNGGLFKRDEILDDLSIPDEVLENFQKLTDYDFGSDLNVNILGHIFEQSISDLEQIKSMIEGTEVDRINGKQKADGIFYTPEYVTRFIAEKTIGRWLDDEKEKIKQTFNGKWKEMPENGEMSTRTLNAIIKMHIEFWEKYTERLKAIKVLDPSCGSGAFLNCAFDYLAEEGRYTVDMVSSLRGGQQAIFDWDTHILENNLYGVDLNGESVEITKLSLWLKTADNKKKLAYLDDNIKTGNSIISDPEIAGEKAFNWQTEFEAIMSNGGFDVVLGNPPYGARLNQKEKDYLAQNYITTEFNFDTYKTFMELGLKLTKQGGYMGYITPNTFFVLEKGATKLRKFLFENHTLLNVVELFNVFPTAVVEPTIAIFKNDAPPANDKMLEVITIPRKTDLAEIFLSDGNKSYFEQTELREKEGYIFNYRSTKAEKDLRRKIDNISRPLSEYLSVTTGVKPYQTGKGTPPQTRDVVNEKPFEGDVKHDETWRPLARGRTIGKYVDAWDGEYIKYGEWLAEPRNPKLFEGEKLFVRQTSDHPVATYYSNGKIGNNTLHCVYSLDEDAGVSLKYALGLINSKLMKWVFQYDNFHIVGKPLAETKKVYVERLPLIIADDQQPIIDLVDALLGKHQSRHEAIKAFTGFTSDKFKPKKITERITNFYTLDFTSFLDELKKQRAKIYMAEEMELRPIFAQKSQEIFAITTEILALDAQLDNIIFDLYKLGIEERELMQNNNQR